MDDPIIIAATIFPIILVIVSIALSYIYMKYRKLRVRFASVIDIDNELLKTKNEILRSRNIFEQLNNEYNNKNRLYAALKKEISILEENLEDISYGFYKPHYNFESSEGYKLEIEKIRDRERDLIRGGKAAICSANWSVGGSEKEGQRMTKQNMKLVLRAFNGECDAALAKVSWNNVLKMEERIKKCFDLINQLGSVLHVSITPDYLKLKLNEIRLTYEYEEKKHQEIEEQRSIKEQMKEEEKVQRELENARREAEKEEERFTKALEKAREEAARATGDQMLKLNEQVKYLENKLNEAHLQKERAISQAQLTKSGHVYVISNIGSFGEDVYKIGMTRRLEPLDRIGELSNASVPFSFDVHAMIYSENAPELENILHSSLEKFRINLINYRKEYFKVNLNEIENLARTKGAKVEFTKLAEAREYRESVELRQKKQNPNDNGEREYTLSPSANELSIATN